MNRSKTRLIESGELQNVLDLLRSIPVSVSSKRFLFWHRLRISGPGWALDRSDELIDRHFGALRDEQVW